MSQIVDTNGRPLTNDPMVEPWLQPMSYVLHSGSHRGPNGEIHARDLFLVVDPLWIGQPRYLGMTYCIFAVPGFERQDPPNSTERTVPVMVPEFNPEHSVALNTLTPEEQQYIMQGVVIADPSRFTYMLTVVNPKIFTLRSNDLRPLTRDIHVVFDPEIPSKELHATLVGDAEPLSGLENSQPPNHNQTEAVRGPENSQPPNHNGSARILHVTAPEPSLNDTERSEKDIPA